MPSSEMSCGSMESYTENFYTKNVFIMEETDSKEMCLTKKIDGENLLSSKNGGRSTFWTRELWKAQSHAITEIKWS